MSTGHVRGRTVGAWCATVVGVVVALASAAFGCVSHGAAEPNHRVVVVDNTNHTNLDAGGEAVCTYHPFGVVWSATTTCPVVSSIDTTVVGNSVKAQNGDTLVSYVSGLGALSPAVLVPFYVHLGDTVGANVCGGPAQAEDTAADGDSEFEVAGPGPGPSFVAEWTVPTDPDVGVGETWQACVTESNTNRTPVGFTNVDVIIVGPGLL